jgi:hypothetical protein
MHGIAVTLASETYETMSKPQRGDFSSNDGLVSQRPGYGYEEPYDARVSRTDL